MNYLASFGQSDAPSLANNNGSHNDSRDAQLCRMHAICLKFSEEIQRLNNYTEHLRQTSEKQLELAGREFADICRLLNEAGELPQTIADEVVNHEKDDDETGSSLTASAAVARLLLERARLLDSRDAKIESLANRLTAEKQRYVQDVAELEDRLADLGRVLEARESRATELQAKLDLQAKLQADLTGTRAALETARRRLSQESTRRVRAESRIATDDSGVPTCEATTNIQLDRLREKYTRLKQKYSLDRESWHQREQLASMEFESQLAEARSTHRLLIDGERSLRTRLQADCRDLASRLRETTARLAEAETELADSAGQCDLIQRRATNLEAELARLRTLTKINGPN